MQFRLTYQGLLLAESTKGSLLAARATHKQDIRKAMHPQLKRLWEINKYLRSADSPSPPAAKGVQFGKPKAHNSIQGLAERFKLDGYRFVPLVTRDIDVLCSLDVLFLRTDPPGSVLSGGDIDNRLKTLFDGLTMPADAGQLGDHRTPADEEDPFFCLLEDDSLITRAAVETDTLLDPNAGPNDARVIVTVSLKPAVARVDTIGFV